ncbi:hypothetical protein O0L34_g1205 [Tuta absoluta]|nr:hypothetical protein O0L34_g1205 [Tuta absoluta]
MVYKCIVPRCNGNYNRENKVSVFSFPKDENLRRLWISAIPRDFIPTVNSKVCERHFREDQLVRTAEAYDSKTGVNVCKIRRDSIKKRRSAVCIRELSLVFIYSWTFARE